MDIRYGSLDLTTALDNTTGKYVASAAIASFPHFKVGDVAIPLGATNNAYTVDVANLGINFDNYAVVVADRVATYHVTIMLFQRKG